MYERSLEIKKFKEVLIDNYFLNPELWYFGIYDKTKHVFFYIMSRNYLEIDEPEWKLEKIHEEMLSRFEQDDENLIAFSQGGFEARIKLIHEFLNQIEDGETKSKLDKELKLQLDNWQPFSLDNVIDYLIPEKIEMWNDIKKDIAEPIINNWIKNNQIPSADITEYIFESE